MKKFVFLFALLLIPYLGYAKTIRVPDDVSTIQGGINLASFSDTVLVQPGLYKESIDFFGRNIVVGSLYLVTGDTTYISQTIIDGDSAKVCVRFGNQEDSTAMLCGFTLTNGNGGIRCSNASPKLRGLIVIDNHYRGPLHENGEGGGIWLLNSKAIIEQVIVCNNNAIGLGISYRNFGAGIYMMGCQVRISDVQILHNQLDYSNNFPGTYGGGIYCYSSSVDLANVKISRNSAELGGGIYCAKTMMNLMDVTVAENLADNFGGGIYLDNSSLIFNKDRRSNIYLNKSAIGSDFYDNGLQITDIYVDTFTVLIPTENIAHPANNFNFHIINSKIEQVNSDLFVSPKGDDSNSGSTSSEPLRTIWTASLKILADSLNPHTIFLANGTYSPIDNGDLSPIYIPHYVSLVGESQDSVSCAGIYLRQNNQSRVENMKIGKPTSWVSGICGIYCDNSSPKLSNLTISNSKWLFGYGLKCINKSNPVLMNVTINENSNSIYLAGNSNPILVNTIIWSDTLQKIYFSETDAPNSITIANSDIQGGLASIETNNKGKVNWLTGNISVDPKFVNPQQDNFHLQQNSPCIDAGIQDTFLVYNNGQDTLFVPPRTFLGAAPDMGSFEFDPGNPTMIDDEKNTYPKKFRLEQNYPNPFNPTTKIRYEIPASPNPFEGGALVQLKIYDVLGREVVTLVNEEKSPGIYEIEFNASQLTSAVYFYQLKAGIFVQTKKMVIIK